MSSGKRMALGDKHRVIVHKEIAVRQQERYRFFL